ncbi:hypothetical protein R1sor_014325 [Riccia sorocarpa]|uniref:Uncharacterized protein n=1 Tax=Riccia sorocarpa TaxID=122646 RepID=A0ABD3HDB9_9MARC
MAKKQMSEEEIIQALKKVAIKATPESNELAVQKEADEEDDHKEVTAGAEGPSNKANDVGGQRTGNTINQEHSISRNTSVESNPGERAQQYGEIQRQGFSRQQLDINSSPGREDHGDRMQIVPEENTHTLYQ